MDECEYCGEPICMLCGECIDWACGYCMCDDDADEVSE